MRSKGACTFGDITVDFDRMELTRAGRDLVLTGLEFRLLQLFVDHPGRVFSRKELLGAAWPRRQRRNARTVDNCMWQVRQKLETCPAEPRYFVTIHGAGYKFVAPFGFARIIPSMRGNLTRTMKPPGAELRAISLIAVGQPYKKTTSK
jgi:DNA-binding response OmpR family regulator